ATDRTPIMARALDGTVIEVFEWTSPEAIERAHTDAKVLAMWADFADACDYVPLDTLSEARAPFAGFEPIE
ncbi:MAG: hypothetical protein KC620_19870, partial [Myxococcales bacterium]|nr:hypothetical protein [Myxococcales bacterium]